MQISNNNIKQENKKLKLEEKNNRNSGIPKPALYTGLSIVGVAAFGTAGKVIWDKLKKNNNNNPGSQHDEFKGWYDHDIVTDEYIVDRTKNLPEKLFYGKVTLSPAVQRWICENIVVPSQNFNAFCWHNVSWLFLLLPEIRDGEEEYKKEFGEGYPEKIKNMINLGNGWIDGYRRNKIKINDYFDNFSEKVKIVINDKTREVPDGLEDMIDKPSAIGSAFLFYTSPAPEKTFNGVRFTERIVNIKDFGSCGCDLAFYQENNQPLFSIGIDDKHIDDLINHIANKNRGFTIAYTALRGIKDFDKTLSYPRKHGFCPTCIIVNNAAGHYHTFWILYNSNGEITNYILYDGAKLTIFNTTFGYEYLKSIIGWKEFGVIQNGGFFVRYSPENIVKKYYTPELMFNANK